MPTMANRAWMSTATTGTGTITLGSALSGYQTFADAGITNGQTVSYTIIDGANWEVGTGTYTSAGTTLTRSVTESSNADSAINLSGSASVFITARATDLPILSNNNAFTGANTFDKTQAALSGTITDNSAADFSTKQSWVADVNGSAFDLLNPSAAPTNDKTFISILFTYTTSHGVTAGSKFKSTGWTPTASAGKKDQTFWRYDSTADQYWLVGVRTDVAT